MKLSVLTAGVLAAVAALASTGACAAALTFTTSAGFSAAIASATTQGTDTFDALNNGANLGTTPLNRTAGSLAYTASSPSGLFAGSTNNGFLTNNLRTDAITTATFASGVNAFGANFFGSDISGAPGIGESIFITVTESDGDIFSTTLTNTRRAQSYFGYIGDSSIASVSFSSLERRSLWPSIDNLTLATGASVGQVPEPMSLALVGLALMGGVAASRRRRQEH